MNLKFFSVYILIAIVCCQPVFGWVSIIFSVISNGMKALDFIKGHWPGDQNRKLEKVSVKDTGNGCTQIIQKLSGDGLTYVNYHVDHDTVYDIVYAAANNGHTYGKLLETLTDKMIASGKGSWVYEVGQVTERVVNKQYSCPNTPTKWTGKYGQYDYHIVLSKGGKCGKMWSVLQESSKEKKAQVTKYNNENNRC